MSDARGAGGNSTKPPLGRAIRSTGSPLGPLSPGHALGRPPPRAAGAAGRPRPRRPPGRKPRPRSNWSGKPSVSAWAAEVPGMRSRIGVVGSERAEDGEAERGADEARGVEHARGEPAQGAWHALRPRRSSREPAPAPDRARRAGRPGARSPDSCHRADADQQDLARGGGEHPGGEHDPRRRNGERAAGQAWRRCRPRASSARTRARSRARCSRASPACRGTGRTRSRKSPRRAGRSPGWRPADSAGAKMLRGISGTSRVRPRLPS